VSPAAVLISGSGSNLAALIEATRQPGFPARIGLVVSNVADAYGLVRARQAGIASLVLDHRGFADRAAFDAAIDRALRDHGIELVCLAGFMRLLGRGFVETWAGRMLNIHPSLLPAFPGLATHKKALEAGVRVSGCTVHFVTAEVDAGPIVVQGVAPVMEGDRPADLQARILGLEHRAYPMALELVAGGRARLENGRVRADEVGWEERLLVHPSLGG